MRPALPMIMVSLVLGACTQAEPDPRGVARDEVLLQVIASGRTDTRPDQARFTAGVQTIAPTAAQASEGNNKVMNQVAAALQRLGVAEDDIQTRQITLQRIEYGPQRGRFQANNMVEVRMRDLRRVSQAIAATSDAGANVISGPNLVVADPEAASRSAYAQAFKAARARAEAYASAAGLKIGRVLTIRDVGDTSGPEPYVGDALMVESGPPRPVSAPPFRPGMNTSEVRVRADFALTQ